MSLSAVVVTLVMAATLINLHYAYFPTPAALFGQVAADQVPASHVIHSGGQRGPGPDRGEVRGRGQGRPGLTAR